MMNAAKLHVFARVRARAAANGSAWHLLAKRTRQRAQSRQPAPPRRGDAANVAAQAAWPWPST